MAGCGRQVASAQHFPTVADSNLRVSLEERPSKGPPVLAGVLPVNKSRVNPQPDKFQ